MATNTAVCSICDQQNITTQSELWCVDCEESFCNNCANYHKMMKATKNHVTIPIEKQLKIADVTADVQQYCQKHSSKLVLFCPKHDQPICIECIGDHTKCGDVFPLSKVLEAAKSTETLEAVSECVEDCISNIHRMTKDREKRKAILQREKMKGLSDVKEFRAKINSHLDLLEERFLMKMAGVALGIFQEVQETIDDLKQKENDLQMEKTKIADIQAHASEIQKYFYIRKVQEKVSKVGRELQDSLDKKLEVTNFTFSLSKDLQDMMTKVTEIGTIKLKREQCRISLSWRENKKAQFLMSLQQKDINDIKLEQVGVFDSVRKGSAVRGCCVVTNEDTFFADHLLSHLVHINNGSKSIIPVWNGAFDVTKIDERRVAVSSGEMKVRKSGVTILNLDWENRERFIELPGNTFGISFSDNQIYSCVARKGIYKVRIDDETALLCLVPLDIEKFSYIHVDRNKLYFTNLAFGKSVVYCYTINGDKLWEYSDKDLLFSNLGITVAKNGNVFVSSDKNHIILAISNDGKRSAVLLTENDGVKKPTGLHYDDLNSKLVVAYLEMKAGLYQIT